MADGTSADQRMLDRMILFSDAVFAFALLLLASDIRLPDGIDDTNIWAHLGELAPQLFSFVISFGLASLWWTVHLSATRELKTFDWPTTLCNLLFLFFIVLLPFAADTFGANMQANTPLGLYWCVNACASAAMTLLYIVMTRDKGRLVGGITGGERLLHIAQSITPGLIFAAGAYWAFTGQIWLSRFCCVLLGPLMMVLGIVSGMMSRAKAKKAVG
jgi:uncharacterized membrane protein